MSPTARERCPKCGYRLQPEVVHDGTPPRHSDRTYTELRWVCRPCRRVQRKTLEES